MQRPARVFRFFILSEKNKKAEAMSDINFLVRYNQSNWKLKLYRAYMYIDMKEYDRAFNDMRPALEATHVSESNFVGRQTNVDRQIDIQNAGNYLLQHLYGLPDEDASSLRKAFCHMILGEYVQTRTVLSERRQLEKYAVSAYFRGICLEHEEHFLLARASYRDALNLDPNIFDANKKCGIIYTSEGKWRQSLPYFDAMEKLNPAYAQTYNLRGVVHYNLADYAKAITDFNKYLESDTTNLEVYYNRGMSQQRLGKGLLALADLVKAKEFGSIDFTALHKTINEYFLSGDTSTLRGYGVQLMKVPSQSGYGVDLEVMKVKLMQLERNWIFIEDRYKRLVLQKTNGDNPGYISSTLAAKAAQHLEVGDLDEAESLLTKSIKYDQRNWIAYLGRARVHLRRSELEKGMEDLMKAAGMGDKQATDLLERLQKN
jgi:tetratricopeptide (TPR) repeat protein